MAAPAPALSKRVTVRECNKCIPKCEGRCGRVIEPDGSVRPARDTGFRVGMHWQAFSNQ